jgi:hypothetical protein
MAVNDVLLCQRAVTELVIMENNSAAEIFGRLRHVYEDSCMGASSARR